MFQKLLWLWFKSDEIKKTQPSIRPSEVEVLMKFADWLDTFGLTLHAPVGSVAGIENSKDVENDRPKASHAEELHDYLRQHTVSKYCPHCGKRLSS